MAARNASWTKAATVIALILQASFIIAAFVFFVLIVHVIINPDTVSGKPVSIYFYGVSFSVNDVAAYTVGGKVSISGVVLYLLYGCAQAIISAAAFNRIYAVLEYSKTRPPFRWENVEKLRKAGFLFLSTVLLQFLLALLGMIFVRDVITFAVNIKLDNAIIGVIILCVAQIFAQGVQMQEEQDGLV